MWALRVHIISIIHNPARMKHFLSAALMLCIGFFLAACSESVEEEYVANYGETVKVHFDIAAENPAPQTRAANEGNYVADVKAWELIKQYRVAFANPTSGAIYAVADKVLANTVESDPIDIELRAGTYKVYAFANIDFDELNTLGITKGGTIPTDLGTKRFAINKYFGSTLAHNLLPMETFQTDFASGANFNDGNLANNVGNVGIPMTSINGQEVTVTERINQTFGIEVRRLLAKLQFDFRYPLEGGAPLYLMSQSVKNLTFGTDVLLMNYEEARNTINGGAAITDYQELIHSYGTSGQTLNVNTTKTDGVNYDKVFTKSFYVLESQGDAETNSFELNFDIRKNPAVAADDEVRYAITQQENLTLIHRNDWIIIPVTIGEWLMDIDVYCYPPIGGYPEAHIDHSTETEFHVTFDSPGDIALYLNFHKFYDPSSKFYLTDASRIKSVNVTTPKGDDIFMAGKKPKYAAGEITAALENVEGTAYIDVTVQFIPDPTQPSVTKTMKRRIYLTRKGII